MTCEYFYRRMGNGISIAVGEGYELGKFWFKKDGESTTPITEAEAETLAQRFVDYLNKEHPITEDMVEKFGDSDETKSKMEELDKMAQSVSTANDDDGFKEFKAKLMMAALMGGL